MMSVLRSSSAAPVSVSTTSRVVRWNNRVPSSASSRAIDRLMFDFGKPSARAAPVKLFSDATFSNTRNELRSSILHCRPLLHSASSRWIETYLKRVNLHPVEYLDQAFDSEELIRWMKQYWQWVLAASSPAR